MIGGGTIYEQTIDLWDQLEITLVDATLEADTYFPKIDEKIWQKTQRNLPWKRRKESIWFLFSNFTKRLASNVWNLTSNFYICTPNFKRWIST